MMSITVRPAFVGIVSCVVSSGLGFRLRGTHIKTSGKVDELKGGMEEVPLLSTADTLEALMAEAKKKQNRCDPDKLGELAEKMVLLSEEGGDRAVRAVKNLREMIRIARGLWRFDGMALRGGELACDLENKMFELARSFKGEVANQAFEYYEEAIKNEFSEEAVRSHTDKLYSLANIVDGKAVRVMESIRQATINLNNRPNRGWGRDVDKALRPDLDDKLVELALLAEAEATRAQRAEAEDMCAQRIEEEAAERAEAEAAEPSKAEAAERSKEAAELAVAEAKRAQRAKAEAECAQREAAQAKATLEAEVLELEAAQAKAALQEAERAKLAKAAAPEVELDQANEATAAEATARRAAHQAQDLQKILEADFKAQRAERQVAKRARLAEEAAAKTKADQKEARAARQAEDLQKIRALLAKAERQEAKLAKAAAPEVKLDQANEATAAEATPAPEASSTLTPTHALQKKTLEALVEDLEGTLAGLKMPHALQKKPLEDLVEDLEGTLAGLKMHISAP